ncbi:MAG: MscS Mechanosensitive ion channel [Sphingomonas bacterium]|uniref:mechanosensitive ion channel family protein n=1 Tax=Sphingomonas bacterium TaxID=1895847 RepID=UPI0026235F15|nr:mechanosensitive ion channel domain-containing protein [Sphingomonas bacterium]MDB5705477.1 MscS Mechanosensitive ion channel [Sphingomonas bacterium]
MTTNATATRHGLAKSSFQGDVDGFLGQARSWFEGHWVQIAIAIATGIGIFLLLQLVRGYAVRLCKRGEGVATWYSIVGRALAKTSNFFIAMSSARLVIGYAHAPPLAAKTIVFLFTISAALQAAIWVREIVFGAVEHRIRDVEHSGRGLASALGVIRLLVSISVFAVALVVVLGNLGVNVSGLIAGLGVGGIAIGLAAQGIFADLFAALAILFDRPFRVGDSISYDGGSGSGTVEAIGLKSTRIRGGNGEQRIIANKKLLDFEILNTTLRQHNRFKYDFWLGYATPPDTVRRLPGLLKEAVASQGYTLVHGGLNGFAASGLKYDVEFESTAPDFPDNARDLVAAAILDIFRKNDISFAYPTQVNLLAEKTKPAPPAAPAAGPETAPGK